MKQNKRGISPIIATLLLIVISIGVIAIVAVVVNNLVNQKIGEASSCFGNFDKLTLSSKHTCWNSSTQQINFMVNVGDINLSGIRISITSSEKSRAFTINGTSQQIQDLMNSTGGNIIGFPQSNSGTKYIYQWSGTDVPDSIEIAPFVGGNLCSSTNSISPITDCNLLY
jgi:FlaG/FlaF family flagellin (archaellin)